MTLREEVLKNSGLLTEDVIEERNEWQQFGRMVLFGNNIGPIDQMRAEPKLNALNKKLAEGNITKIKFGSSRGETIVEIRISDDEIDERGNVSNSVYKDAAKKLTTAKKIIDGIIKENPKTFTKKIFSGCDVAIRVSDRAFKLMADKKDVAKKMKKIVADKLNAKVAFSKVKKMASFYFYSDYTKKTPKASESTSSKENITSKATTMLNRATAKKELVKKYDSGKIRSISSKVSTEKYEDHLVANKVKMDILITDYMFNSTCLEKVSKELSTKLDDYVRFLYSKEIDKLSLENKGEVPTEVTITYESNEGAISGSDAKDQAKKETQRVEAKRAMRERLTEVVRKKLGQRTKVDVMPKY